MVPPFLLYDLFVRFIDIFIRLFVQLSDQSYDINRRSYIRENTDRNTDYTYIHISIRIVDFISIKVNDDRR